LKYAEKTSVSAHRSIEEIDHILKRYGATQFATGRDDEGRRAIVTFKIKGIAYKLEIPLPDPKDFEFRISRGFKYKRTPLQITQLYEQSYKQRWRAMALVIKAKLEAAEAGISSIEQEFMQNILLPDGRTVKDVIIPQLAAAVQGGQMLKELPFFNNAEVKS